MPPEEPTPTLPINMSRAGFDLFFASFTGTTEWYYADSVLRRDLVGDAFKSLPVIWDRIKDRGVTWLQNFYDDLVNFAGPPIPEVPPSQYIEEWFYNTDGWIIEWALSPTNLLESGGDVPS